MLILWDEVTSRDREGESPLRRRVGFEDSQRGREGREGRGKGERDMRERETEIGMMVAAPTMYRMVTMCQTLYFCHIV